MAPATSIFTQDTLRFLSALQSNNDRDWFAENKARYKSDFEAPARFFADVMAHELESLTGRTQKAKIFRIYRDVRFSKDKRPYNAHLHVSFVPDGLARPPAWLFGFSPSYFSLGCGVFSFEKNQLAEFRARLTGSEETGDAIAWLLAEQEKAGARISEAELKRVPAGLPKDHPYEALLRHKSLAVWRDQPDLEAVTSPNLITECMTQFSALKPVYDLLMDL